MTLVLFYMVYYGMVELFERQFGMHLKRHVCLEKRVCWCVFTCLTKLKKNGDMLLVT